MWMNPKTRIILFSTASRIPYRLLAAGSHSRNRVIYLLNDFHLRADLNAF